MKKKMVFLTAAMIAVGAVCNSQYYYDNWEYFKECSDFCLKREDWHSAAEFVIEMLEINEPATTNYLLEYDSSPLRGAIVDVIASDLRRVTLDKLIYALWIYDVENRYEEALRLCNELSDLFGYNEHLNFYKGKSYYALGLEGEATRSFVKMLQINPQLVDVQTMFLAGKMQYVSGDIENGLIYMSAAVDSCNTPEAYLDYAIVCYLQGRYDEAIRYLTAVVNYGKEVSGTMVYDNIRDGEIPNDTKAMSYFIKWLCMVKMGLKPNAEATCRMLLKYEEGEKMCCFSNVIFRHMREDENADSCLAYLTRNAYASAAEHYAAAYGLVLSGRYKDALQAACRCVDVAYDPLWEHLFTEDPFFSKIKRGVKRYSQKRREMMAKKFPAKNYRRSKVTLPFFWESGVMVVACHVNAVPTLVYFDSGSSDVQLTKGEWDRMVLEGVLTEDDVIGRVKTVNADGDVTEGASIVLRSILLGDLALTDVRATISESPQAMLLLGQSVLSRFEKVEIDYEKFTVTLTYKEEVK